MKKRLFVAAIALMAVACSKNDGGNPNVPQENPDPTTFGNVWLVKSDIVVDPDGFNMFTDGGFERFTGDEEWKSKSLWYLPEYISEAETPYNGNRTIYADCNIDGWRDVAIQSICLKKNSSYTLTTNFRGAWDGLNAYIGFRGVETHDMNTNTEGVGSQWKEYSMTYNNVDDVKVDAFMGGWCYYNLWFEADDFKVIPSGTNNDSFMPQNASVIGTTITNASFNEVGSVDKIVAWIEPDGNIAAVLHNAVIDGTTVGNVFASSNDSNATDGVKLLTVDSADMLGSENVIPTSGTTIGQTRYVRYYIYGGKPEATEENPDPDWAAVSCGLLSSTDGSNWSDTGLQWAADGNFVKASFMKHNDYVYMFGSAAGDKAPMTYVARVAASEIGNQGAYQYWDGSEWVAGDEEAAAPICYGPTDDMSVAYNSSRYTYMMIYRSNTTGCLVYRDAGMPEGEWSGEKILMADPDADTALYAPHILSISNDSMYFIASKRQ